ncbi:unnamed protein product, partial [Brassica oleracea var. botrytis]
PPTTFDDLRLGQSSKVIVDWLLRSGTHEISIRTESSWVQPSCY